MTKLGKAAVTAMSVACLSGCLFLANPFSPVVEEQQVYENTVAHAGYLQNQSHIVYASAGHVDVNENREVAGFAALISGELEMESVQVQSSRVSAGMAAIMPDLSAAETTQQAAATVEKEKVVLTAKVDNSLNIRRKPDENSKVVGKLFRGCSAEVIKEKDSWYKIRSGKVTGWVSSKYAVTGEKAEKYLDKVDPSVAEVTATTLNLRKKASTDGDVVAVLNEGTRYMVIDTGKEWVHIRYTSELDGYVSAEYVDVSEEPGVAVSAKILDIYKERAAKKEAEREAARKAKEAEEARKKAEQQSSGSSSSSGSSTSADSDEVTLLAALCQHEAGTNYSNCLAVANVVLNRVHSSSYPDSIRGVIFQRGQFSGVNRGALNRFLPNPSSTCYQAARDALAGNNNIGSRKQFRAVWATNPSAHSNSVVIGDNCFF